MTVETVEKPSIEERVGNGMAFLDEHVPGWRERVNARKLVLIDCDRCVLGQLYGEFNMAREHLGISWKQSIRLGFNAEGLSEEPFKVLTAAWKRALA